MGKNNNNNLFIKVHAERFSIRGCQQEPTPSLGETNCRWDGVFNYEEQR